MDLSVVNRFWADCRRCVLSTTERTQVVVGSGPAPSAMMVIGEAPGEQEDEKGVPFVGAAGDLLRNEARAVGVNLWKCAYVTNLCGCRPPENRTPMPDEINACRLRLTHLVAAVRPNALLLLGATALVSLTGRQGIHKCRGRWVDTQWEWKGEKVAIPAMPTFHPAGLLGERLREPRDLVSFRNDIRAAYNRAYAVE